LLTGIGGLGGAGIFCAHSCAVRMHEAREGCDMPRAHFIKAGEQFSQLAEDLRSHAGSISNDASHLHMRAGCLHKPQE
jgi:hypothetical protein